MTMFTFYFRPGHPVSRGIWGSYTRLLSSNNQRSVFFYLFAQVYESAKLLLNLSPKHFYWFKTIPGFISLLRKWSFPLRISSVNVTKSLEIADLVTFTEEILVGKLHFLCSICWTLKVPQDAETYSEPCQIFF